MRVAGLLGLDLRGIEPVRQSAHAFDAPRPPDVSLDSSRAREALGWEPRSLDDAIRSGRLRPD
jgi:dTDP-4-dehydrorhamnose reductase